MSFIMKTTSGTGLGTIAPKQFSCIGRQYPMIFVKNQMPFELKVLYLILIEDHYLPTILVNE
jgi:hypothetical protein